MISDAATPALEDQKPAVQPGGVSRQQQIAPHPPGFKAVGILYARKTGNEIEFCAVYESHVESDIALDIESKFGVAAVPWKEK